MAVVVAADGLCGLSQQGSSQRVHRILWRQNRQRGELDAHHIRQSLVRTDVAGAAQTGHTKGVGVGVKPVPY